MTKPCIISVAITGSVPRKKDNPAVPITVDEQVESAHEAYEAGAALVHIHVRDKNENPSSDPKKFSRVKAGIRKHCSDMIIQFSTGGRGIKKSERSGMLSLKPDMASLATGSVNFPTTVYENPPDLVHELAETMLRYGIKPEVEVFDMAMLYTAVDMAKAGLLKTPIHVQFVFGLKNALPAKKEILEFQVKQLSNMMPDATWTAAGIGKGQLDINKWTLELGGNCRTGLEDNIRYNKEHLAISNAELVSRVSRLCKEHGRRPATAKEAREILSLPMVTK